MTTINSLDDFLEALRNDPQWQDAVQAQILSEDLLQLPTKFEAFVEEQKAQNQRLGFCLENVENTVQELNTRTTNQEDAWVPLRAIPAPSKGDFARIQTVQDAQGLASHMGLEFVRTLSTGDLSEITGNILT